MSIEMVSFARLSLAAVVLAGLVMVPGCGDDTTPVIVGGNDPKYQRPAEAEDAYKKAMEQSRKQTNQ